MQNDNEGARGCINPGCSSSCWLDVKEVKYDKAVIGKDYTILKKLTNDSVTGELIPIDIVILDEIG